jgi:tetratricopeptide (TPR) repeat protein
MNTKGERALQRAKESQKQNLPEIAAEAYQEAIGFFKEDQNFARQAAALTSLGEMYDRLLCNYQKALETYQQSLRLRQIYGLKNLSEEYFNVALQQNFLGKLSEAKDNLERGRHSAEREGNQRVLAKILNLLGDILVEEGHLRESQKHLQASQELATAEGDEHMISHVQSSIGLLLACQQRYEEAIKTCQTALSQAERIADDGAIGTAQLRFGQALWLQGNYSEAQEHLQKALEMAQKANIKILRETALEWVKRCGEERSPRPGPPDGT